MNKFPSITLTALLQHISVRWLVFSLIFVLFIATSEEVTAQIDTCTHVMRGKILDVETNEPIPYVSIKVKDVNTFTVTDMNGEFKIEGLCQSENVLIISCFGYCDAVCEALHEHGKMPHIFLKQKVLELNEIVVLAGVHKEEGTVSLSQQTLKGDQLTTNPTQSLAAALTTLDGVSMMSTGTNVQLPVIHGLYGNRILILNNGLKHGFQNWGTEHAPEIDLSSAHHLTVYKGAAGVRFGPEALGGAIAIESNPLHLQKPFYVNTKSGFQSNGRGVFNAISIGKGSKNWGYFISGSLTKIGDRHTPDYQLTNSGKNEKSLSAGIRYQLDQFDFEIHYSYIDQNLALLRSSVADSGNGLVNAMNAEEPLYIAPFSYEINEPNQLTKHQLGKAELSWSLSESSYLTIRTGIQLNDRQEYDVRRSAEKPIIDLSLMTQDFQLEWKHPDWLKLDGLIGLQAFAQHNENNPGTSTTPFIPNYKTKRWSGFLMESLQHGQTTFEAGLRIDIEKNIVRGRDAQQDIYSDKYEYSNLTSSIGLIRKFSEKSSFRSNLGAAWRTPNMAELYSFGQHGFKTTFGLLRYTTSNESALSTNRVTSMNESDVIPEKGYKWINEWSTSFSKQTITTTIYGHYIQNYIYGRPVAVIGTIRGPMPVFIVDQVDVALFGADFTWQQHWTNKIDGTLGMSYLWSRNIEKNEPMINQPPLNINYEWTIDLPSKRMLSSSQFKIKPSYTFQQFTAPRTVTPQSLIAGSEEVTPQSEIFDFKDAPNGYFLLDLGWTCNMGHFQGSIELKNALNKKYRNYLNEMRYFADEPGRNILLTLNYSFHSKLN